MTLTEFLLARIAEDEERAQFVARQIEGNNWQPFEQWKLSWHDEYDLLCIEPSRALTDCEAKRRIVDRHHFGHPHECPGNGVHTYYRTEIGCPTLRDLAAIYADHPDYDESWRP